jgi:hypothetical protein
VTDAATSGALEPQNATNSGESPAADAFKTSLQNSAPGAVSPTSQLSPQTGAERLSALASQVESGHLNMDQAVEQLVDQTVASMGSHLSTAQRAELSELLRSALATDPTLQGLRSDRG